MQNISKQCIGGIVLVIVLIGGGWFWYVSKTTSQGQVTPIVTENQNQQVVETQPTTVQNDTYPRHIVAIPGSTEVWYEIPELGIKMRMDKGFANDLVYKVHDSNSAELSSLSIITIDKACSPENSYEMSGASGTIVRINGTIEAFVKQDNWRPLEYYTSLEKLGLLKKFDSFFVEYVSPQSPCDGGLNTSIEDISNHQAPMIHDAIKTIELLK